MWRGTEQCHTDSARNEKSGIPAHRCPAASPHREPVKNCHLRCIERITNARWKSCGGGGAIPWSSRVLPLLAVISSPVPSPLSGPFEGGSRLRNAGIRGLIGTATHPLDAVLLQAVGLPAGGSSP